ncbi:MAG TPA: hypothetical protein VM869_16750 [Enhygromyxa sp.]|nr:hypothetical protein [Enhygromyxa sp.]
MTRRSAFAALLSLFAVSACEGNDGSNEGADTDAETETDGDGDGADTADDSASCELWEGDATYPGDCNCASPGEECAQGCLIPDGVQTCADVCEALGETCVENACDGGTFIGGYTCPAPSEYSPATAHPCDEPVPVGDPIEESDWGVACCCTRS